MAGTAPTPQRVDPWRLARDTAASAGVDLRPLRSIEDAEALRDVLRATWNGQDLPNETVRALAHSGNVPWGAFVGDELVAYVLGWAGVDEDGLHLHSHMLATLSSYRGRGVGAALKFAQRAQALEQGIFHARWTFDPMRSRNAIFNLNRLGATADRFHRNFYGDMQDDLNRGERSDRLVIRWDLAREPGPRPIGDGAVRVAIPADHVELRTEDPSRASAAREEAACGIEAALATGLVATGFDVETSSYVFSSLGGER